MDRHHSCHSGTTIVGASPKKKKKGTGVLKTGHGHPFRQILSPLALCRLLQWNVFRSWHAPTTASKWILYNKNSKLNSWISGSPYPFGTGVLLKATSFPWNTSVSLWLGSFFFNRIRSTVFCLDGKCGVFFLFPKSGTLLTPYFSIRKQPAAACPSAPSLSSGWPLSRGSMWLPGHCWITELLFFWLCKLHHLCWAFRLSRLRLIDPRTRRQIPPKSTSLQSNLPGLIKKTNTGPRLCCELRIRWMRARFKKGCTCTQTLVGGDKHDGRDRNSRKPIFTVTDRGEVA